MACFLLLVACFTVDLWGRGCRYNKFQENRGQSIQRATCVEIVVKANEEITKNQLFIIFLS